MPQITGLIYSKAIVVHVYLAQSVIFQIFQNSSGAFEDTPGLVLKNNEMY